MKSKSILFIALFSLMLLALNTAMAAPLNITSMTISHSIAYPDDNVTISYTINNTGASAINATAVLTISGLNLSYSDSPSISANSSVSLSHIINVNSSMLLGLKTASLFVDDDSNSSINDSKSTSFSINYPYCSNRTADPIKIYELTNDDDIAKDKYKPLESFVVKLKVQNLNTDTDDDDIDMTVSAVLVRDGEEVDDTEVDKDLTLGSKDKESVALTMQIPSDAEAGKYYLYIKITNDDDEDNCDQKVIEVTVQKKARELVLDGLVVPTTIACGSTTAIKGSIINIGNSDEDKVKVVYSDTFGETATQIINSLDSGDKAALSFSLKVPKNVTEGEHSASFDVYYKYDEDDDTYDDQSDTFVYLFKVAGSCQQLIETQTISTEASTAIVGTESEVRVTIANTGTVSQTYSVSANADWADIKSITPSSALLAAGESREIIIKLNAKSSTEIGTHQMLVSVQHGGISESRTVDVSVQKSSSPSGLIDQLKFQMKFNPTWVIIDAALVLAIVIVIVSLLAGKKKSA